MRAGRALRGRAGFWGAATIVAAISAPVAASAADGNVERAADLPDIVLSTDGLTWSAELPPLFDTSGLWVPGDVAVRSFYVRNDGPVDADLSITVTTEAGSDQALSQDLGFAARLDGGQWSPIAAAASTAPGRVDQAAIAPKAVRKVEIRAVFDPAAQNQSQSERIDLSFTVGLAEQVAGLPQPVQPGAGTLPGTGAEALEGPFGWGLAMTLGGLLLAASAWRRPRVVSDHG